MLLSQPKVFTQKMKYASNPPRRSAEPQASLFSKRSDALPNLASCSQTVEGNLADQKSFSGSFERGTSLSQIQGKPSVKAKIANPRQTGTSELSNGGLGNLKSYMDGGKAPSGFMKVGVSSSLVPLTEAKRTLSYARPESKKGTQWRGSFEKEQSSIPQLSSKGEPDGLPKLVPEIIRPPTEIKERESFLPQATKQKDFKSNNEKYSSSKSKLAAKQNEGTPGRGRTSQRYAENNEFQSPKTKKAISYIQNSPFVGTKSSQGGGVKTPEKSELQKSGNKGGTPGKQSTPDSRPERPFDRLNMKIFNKFINSSYSNQQRSQPRANRNFNEVYPMKLQKTQSTKPSSTAHPSTSSLESINSPYISVIKSSSSSLKQVGGKSTSSQSPGRASFLSNSAFDDPNFSSAIQDHTFQEKLRCLSTKSVDSSAGSALNPTHIPLEKNEEEQHQGISQSVCGHSVFQGPRSASGSVSPHQDSAVSYLLSHQCVPLMFKKNTFSSPKIVKAMHEVQGNYMHLSPDDMFMKTPQNMQPNNKDPQTPTFSRSFERASFIDEMRPRSSSEKKLKVVPIFGSQEHEQHQALGYQNPPAQIDSPFSPFQASKKTPDDPTSATKKLSFSEGPTQPSTGPHKELLTSSKIQEQPETKLQQPTSSFSLDQRQNEIMSPSLPRLTQSAGGRRTIAAGRDKPESNQRIRLSLEGIFKNKRMINRDLLLDNYQKKIRGRQPGGRSSEIMQKSEYESLNFAPPPPLISPTNGEQTPVYEGPSTFQAALGKMTPSSTSIGFCSGVDFSSRKRSGSDRNPFSSPLSGEFQFNQGTDLKQQIKERKLTLDDLRVETEEQEKVTGRESYGGDLISFKGSIEKQMPVDSGCSSAIRIRSSTASYDQRTSAQIQSSSMNKSIAGQRANRSFRDSVSPVRVVQDLVDLEAMKKKAEKYVLNSEPHVSGKGQLLKKDILKPSIAPLTSGATKAPQFSMKRSQAQMGVKREGKQSHLIDERNIRLKHKDSR